MSIIQNRLGTEANALNTTNTTSEFSMRSRDLIQQGAKPELIEVSNWFLALGVAGLTIVICPFLLICGVTLSIWLLFGEKYGATLAERLVVPIFLVTIVATLQLLAMRKFLQVPWCMVIDAETVSFGKHRTRQYRWNQMKQIRVKPVPISVITLRASLLIESLKRTLSPYTHEIRMQFDDGRRFILYANVDVADRLLQEFSCR